jgi:hypothetical protein
LYKAGQRERELKKMEAAKSKFDVNYENDTLVTKRVALNVQVRYSFHYSDDQGKVAKGCSFGRSFNLGKEILDWDRWINGLLSDMPYWTSFCADKGVAKDEEQLARIMYAKKASNGKNAKETFHAIHPEPDWRTLSDLVETWFQPKDTIYLLIPLRQQEYADRDEGQKSKTMEDFEEDNDSNEEGEEDEEDEEDDEEEDETGRRRPLKIKTEKSESTGGQMQPRPTKVAVIRIDESSEDDKPATNSAVSKTSKNGKRKRGAKDDGESGTLTSKRKRKPTIKAMEAGLEGGNGEPEEEYCSEFLS